MTPGEEWIRVELARLQSRRYAPVAIAEFLAVSQRRAGDVRRERPHLGRRARTWEAAGAAAWVGLACAGREPYRRRLVSGLAWWALTSLMLEWHLGMVESEDGEPRNLGPADALTLARAWLAPVIADDLAPAALLAAGVSDALDGPLARAGVPTRAGRDLEALADAAVHIAALRCAWRQERMSRAVVGVEIVRVATGSAYAACAYFVQLRAPNATVMRAGRVAAPVRVAGLIAAGAGRRRTANALLAAGSLASLVVLASDLSRVMNRSGPAGV
ncbi:hypothetical protein NBH00_23710 [Paraconexibacter antarcticus]|uniref:CDP-alcohol phosphatidyltransferase family protein n=1 Tax=Paraconexibacter antarcticus TaxID=2949664 RepID=A0ABY5DUF5_9ACTN|nr:CDP-alcohol phosphatidyltransferase family protein [Paraconexibacter antarcticus]UTI64332.1 hypothetical protein NBH00_23710 [Paraconexibacter antarcticus]